ncbi:hypothetical protein [Nocardia sp. NPDC050718]|uniref:hypothetical protein n=1 Tax=Nocardia sp. NPDC050718 TaxID=3155788 RepID=UPI0033C994FC
MTRGPLVFVGAAVAAFCGAVGALVAADSLLGERKRELLAAHCATVVDVPGGAVLLNSLGAGLLLGTVVLLAGLIVALTRAPARWRPGAITVAGLALVGVGVYATLVTVATISPDATEPGSADYHPCATRA